MLVMLGCGGMSIWANTCSPNTCNHAAKQGRSGGRAGSRQAGRALALGIPFDRLMGVEAYFDELLTQHPELAGIRLRGADRRSLRTQPLTSTGPGQQPATPRSLAPGGAVAVVVQTDPRYVGGQMGAGSRYCHCVAGRADCVQRSAECTAWPAFPTQRP